MTMQLDKRQRAMLREIGVRVWQPTLAAPSVAQTPETAPATNLSAAATAEVVPRPLTRPVEPALLPPLPASDVSAASVETPSASLSSQSEVSGWRIGQTQALYAASAKPTGARWLVVVEVNAAALDDSAFNPFDGDAGKLLDNMLRAASLHHAASAQLLPLVRDTDTAASNVPLQAALAPLLRDIQPDLVLVMGRLLAQALLPSGEAFGRLRGQQHSLQDKPLVVTQDAAYLLRKPEEKDRAWDDLCLAMRVVAGTVSL